MTFGLIGLNWGGNYIKNINVLGGKILSVCSLTKESYLKLENHPEDAAWTNNYKDLTTDKEIDSIIIATPPATHKEIILDCIKHKKHIIVEKPLSLTLSDAEDIKLALKTHKKKFLVNYIHLWSQQYQEIKSHFDKKSGIIVSESSGGKRHDYSFIQDYGSHELAMLLDLIGEKELREVKVLRNDEYGYNFELGFDNVKFNSNFTFGRKHPRIFNVSTESDRLEYREDRGDNILKNMLKEFIEAKEYNNFDLAYRVTGMIEKIEKESSKMFV